MSERKTWADALTYCKQNYVDLASIHDSEEQADVRQAAEKLERKKNEKEKSLPVWTGLYNDKDGWEWSDAAFYGQGEDEFRSWASGQPDNLSGDQHCVALLPLPHSGWEDNACTDLKGSVCYDGKCFYCTYFSNTLFLMVRLQRLLRWFVEIVH